MTWGVLNTKPVKPPARDEPSPPACPEEYTTVGPRTYESYSRRTITVLSVIQLFCGMTCIALGIVRIYATEGHEVRYEVGICEGAFFLVTGIVGIISAAKKTRMVISLAAVFSAFSCVLALFIGLGWMAFGLLHRGCHGSFKRHRRDRHDSDSEEEDDDDDHMHVGKRPYQDKHRSGDSWLRRQESDRHHDRPHPEGPPMLEEKFLTIRAVDWILMVIFVTVIVCGVVVVVKALQALKKKRRESTTDTQETQVFVITAEKGAVIS